MKRPLIYNEWQPLETDWSTILTLKQRFDMSEVLANLLVSRGLDVSQVDDFLNPKLKNLMPDPFALLDIRQGVDFVVNSIHAGKKIAVFGDYDVDGACSSALIANFLRLLNIDCEIYIPDRIEEGYGPNTNALLGLKNRGVDLVITVDCGTVAFKPLEDANKAGLDIIVIDHHLGVKQKPHSIAVINPNRFDETTDLTYLCGAGVTFVFLVALNKTLREQGYYAKHRLAEPNLICFLDLVALATICDVVPLIGLNRAFVKTGLKVLENTSNIGLKSLMEILELTEKPNEFHLGFLMGPRINAGGRVGDSALGSSLLTSTDTAKALAIARQLDECNKQRKLIEDKILQTAHERTEMQKLQDKPIIFIGDEDFHQGLIGIIAGRLKEKYHKPVAVLEFRNGVAKASLRSVAGIDIGALINIANKQGLLIAGGGHEMAGGFSCKMENLSRVQDFFEDSINHITNVTPIVRSLQVDLALSFGAVNLELYKEIELLSPFGCKNSKPIFYCNDIQILKTEILKDKHLTVLLKCNATQKTVRTVIFNFDMSPLGACLRENQGRVVDVAFNLKFNDWNNQVEIQLLDIRY